MSAEWELICHHTYDGIPGVVIDRSPFGATHGLAIGLNESDFLADGSHPGSGAVHIEGETKAIHLPAESPAWRTLEGLKGEAVVRCRQATHNVILFSNSFVFSIVENDLFGEFGSVHINTVSEPFKVPHEQWITLGFMYDGFGTLELSADGEVVARVNGTYGPLRPMDQAGIRVGNNDVGGDRSLKGDIDVLKIWRLKPRRVYDEFHSRRMSEQAANCWKAFEDELRAALLRNPECATRLLADVQKTVLGTLRAVLALGPDERELMNSAAETYRKLWHAGRIETREMTECITGVLEFLRSVGLDPKENPDLNELLNSKCFQEAIAGIRPPDCDRQLVKMIESVLAQQP